MPPASDPQSSAMALRPRCLPLHEIMIRVTERRAALVQTTP
jgi:hypothetical protein